MSDDGNRKLSWRARFVQWRNELLQTPAFLRWAARFPLTRPLARRRTSDLFDLVTGFVHTQIVTACLEVGLLDPMRAKPASLAELSSASGLDEEAAQRLVRGAVALGLVESVGDDLYALGELGAALVSNPGITSMVQHHRILYDDLRDPVGLLKDRKSPTRLSQYWAYAQAGAPDDLAAEAVGDYSALMAASQSFICDEVLDAYPLSRHLHLLDIGGGEGRFAQAALSRAPNLRATVFDLPAVAERAKNRLANSDLQSRFDAVGGSFFADELPRGCDLISLVRILHDHDDDKVLHLLRRIREAVDSKARLLIAEPLAATPGAERAGDAYFGFYLLAMRSGRPRTEAELSSLLSQAGFRLDARPRTATPLLVRVLIARPV
ncbi:MAG: methyltransferase [Pseudomonadota bacterium]